MFAKIRRFQDQWNTYKARLKNESTGKYWIVETVEALSVALVFALLIRHFIIMVSVVPTSSMVPTLMVGDRLFVTKFIYRFTDPKRGDIVVFKSVVDDKDYVKRMIALPGETVEVKKGVVYVNGKEVFFPGVNIQYDYDSQDPITVPPGHYYVMGDNRAFSSDSRVWGFVPRDNFEGEALFTFWPLTRMQMLH
jgi:signal peptidase I